jgi:carbohydrate kinase (thermoresistant glucokinase family)
MQAGVPLDDDDRWPWLSAVRLQMERAEFEESNLVATCSALKRAYRRILIPRNSPIQLVHLTGDRRLISDRLESRKRHFMPPELLASQFASLEPPRANERCINVDVRQTPQASVTAIRQALKVGSS